MGEEMKLQIFLENKKIRSEDVAITIDEVLRRMAFSKFTLTVIEDKRCVEINSEEFEEVNLDDEKRNDITIMRSESNKYNYQENMKHFIQYSTEMLVETWLKFGCTEIKCSFDKDTKKFYYEFNKGFKDAQKFWDSMDGWDTDIEFWNRTFDVQDEIHRVGGLRK